MINYDNLLSDTIKDIKPSGIRKFFDLLADICIRLPELRKSVSRGYVVQSVQFQKIVG